MPSLTTESKNLVRASTKLMQPGTPNRLFSNVLCEGYATMRVCVWRGVYGFGGGGGGVYEGGLCCRKSPTNTWRMMQIFEQRMDNRCTMVN